MSEKLSKLIKLIKRTGDRLVVLDQATGDPFVIMDLDSYEQLLDQIPLTSHSLTDKINSDLTAWKERLGQDDFSNDNPWSAWKEEWQENSEDWPEKEIFDNNRDLADQPETITFPDTSDEPTADDIIKPVVTEQTDKLIDDKAKPNLSGFSSVANILASQGRGDG